MSRSVECIVVGPIQCNCYILSETASRKAYVIDPGAEEREILAYLKRNRLEVQAILITHCHIDHIGGIQLVESTLSVPVYFHRGDEFLYRNLAMQAGLFGMTPPDLQASEPKTDGLPLSDGQEFPFDGGSIRVLHTPGHTPGSVCFQAAGSDTLLFSGDTLFQGSIGRTDLWGGSFETIMESIRNRLMPLDDKVQVLPGHGPTTTIGVERDSNPFILGY